MLTRVSSLSLAAACLYILVALACGLAAIAARGQQQQIWHLRAWLILIGLFMVLVALRLVDAENLLRDSLRAFFRSEATYTSRRDFQRPLIGGLVVILAAAAFFWAYRIGRTIRGRRNIATVVALSCGLTMLFLILLRLISLHPVDVLLYGPLKLNWFADIGLSCIVIWSAFRYNKIVRSPR